MEKPVKEKKHDIASRALVATAFGYVGAKLGTIGSLVDANNLLKEEKLTLGQKFKSIFNGKLFAALEKEAEKIVKTENKSKLAAYAKTMKYGIITTVIGAGAAAVVGWIRGGRIDNWKNIAKHPWDSTKIIFGFKEPNIKKDEVKIEAASPSNVIASPKNAEQEVSTNWQNYTKERGQNSAEIGKAV